MVTTMVEYETYFELAHPAISSPRGIFITLDNINTFSPRQNGRHFADGIFKSIFLKENIWISINDSLKFVLGVKLKLFQHWLW